MANNGSLLGWENLYKNGAYPRVRRGKNPMAGFGLATPVFQFL
jgi:hypothetical protein